MPKDTPSNSENKPGISKGAFALTRSSFSVPKEVPEELSAGFLVSISKLPKSWCVAADNPADLCVAWQLII